MRYGHFDTANDEYVIDRPDVPVSFTNYLGRRDYCVVLSHNAGGYSYYRSPQSGRVTRFRPNGVPLDRPGHYVYLRDDADGDYWSVSWQPVGKPLAAEGVEGGARYTAAHGMGYSRFVAAYRGLEATQTIFVPSTTHGRGLGCAGDQHRRHRARPSRWRPTSSSPSTRSRSTTRTCRCRCTPRGRATPTGSSSTTSTTSRGRPTTSRPASQPDCYDSLRDTFIGSYRTETNPIAVERGHGPNRSATTRNHCGSLFHKVTSPRGRRHACPSCSATAPATGGPRDAGQVRRPRHRRRRVRPAARVLAGQAGRPAPPRRRTRAWTR